MCAKASVDGLILREVVSGNDKLLTILTNDGRFTLCCKGARSPRSKMLAVTNLFTYGNFEYYERNGMRWMSEGIAYQHFHGLFSDIKGVALATYIMQVATEISGEGCDSSEVLSMTLNTLYSIENSLKPLEQIKAVYELFAVDVSGMAPNLEGCSVCRKSDEEMLWLDVMNGCLVCDDCIGRGKAISDIPEVDEQMTRNIFIPIDSSALAAMRYTLSAPIKRKFAFALTSEDSLMRLSRATEAYLVNHLERSFDTLDFYRSCKD